MIRPKTLLKHNLNELVKHRDFRKKNFVLGSAAKIDIFSKVLCNVPIIKVGRGDREN
jgi:hypothetical protein